MINVDHIWKSFGKHSILEDISFTVEGGSVYGLVGLNGTGKTTLLRLILGLLSAEKGSIALLSDMSIENRSRLYQRCGIVLEHDGFWGNLSIRDNLLFYAQAKGVSTGSLEKYLDEYWKETGLLKINKKVKFLSRGQKMQCALCRAFMGNPDILLLDEPLIALDLHANNHLCALIKKARDRGCAVIVSSHQLELVDEVCDRVGILRDKKLVEIGKNRIAPWLIKTDNNPLWQSALCESGAQDVNYRDGAFLFRLERDDLIAECVKMLVNLGCRIHGVVKTGDEFSNTIRTLYSDKK